jgi:hypothetical protein
MTYPNRPHGISEVEGTSKRLSELFTAFCASIVPVEESNVSHFSDKQQFLHLEFN